MSNPASVTAVVLATDSAAARVTLDSLHQQTRRPDQVIVIGDGGSGDLSDVASYHGAVCVANPMAGLGAACNGGISAAIGDYVALIEGGDWCAVDKLERSVEHLQELDAACLATDAWLVRGDRVERRHHDGRVVPLALTMELLLLGNPILFSTVVAKRSALQDCGAFDEGSDILGSEDYDLWLRMATREPLAYLPQPLTFCRTERRRARSATQLLAGADRLLDRIAVQHAGAAHFQNLVRRSRCSVRLDVAESRLQNGDRAGARAILSEARHHAHTMRGLRLWFSTWWPR